MSKHKQAETVELEEQDVKGGFTQYLAFEVGSEVYGIDVSSVKEVIEFDKVFRIARASDYIRGVVNLRGEVIPVIDLSSRFYGYGSEVTIHTGIIFIEVLFNNAKVLVGAIIDRVNAVVNIYNKNIESIPEFGSKIRSDFIKDIGKVNNEFIILLNIDSVLNIDELSSME